MEPTTPLSIDVLFGLTCAVMCMVLGAVTMWWENRHRRKDDDDGPDHAADS